MEQPARRGVDATVGYESQRPPRPSAPPGASPVELAATIADAPAGMAATVAIPGATMGLGATMAAPLPLAEGDGAPRPGSTTLSVLPRIEPAGDVVRLVPQDGPRYKQLKKLGAGGMGEVALVEDRDIGRAVAVKRLFEDAMGPASVARFVDEVRTVGNLEHPNIVPIHDVGVDEQGRYFFVMKYVDGETLESIIERLRAGDARAILTYGIQRRIEIFIGLLRALQYAHARGIVHRDVKPANIMIGRYGEIVLMDWGVARPMGKRTISVAEVGPAEMQAAPSRASETHDGALIGTPLYMAPEQAAGRNDELDPRCDLYAACVVFHELLGLRHLRADKTSLAELLASIQLDAAPSATRMFASHPGNPAGVPAELAHFVHRGLEPQPVHRWQSAEEMILELDAILEGRCRVQCPVTLTKRSARELGRFVDRRPFSAIATVVVGALVILALAANAVRDLIS